MSVIDEHIAMYSLGNIDVLDDPRDSVEREPDTHVNLRFTGPLAHSNSDTNTSEPSVSVNPGDLADRGDNGGRKTHEVNELWDLSHKIMDMLLHRNSVRKIAQTLGVSDDLVSHIRNSPVMQKQLVLNSGNVPIGAI